MFTCDQEIEQLSTRKSLQLPIELEPLAQAVNAEILAELEQAARIEQENFDSFNASLDIFESLDPAEIKKVAFETVAGMVESIQIECEKVLAEQRQKVFNQNAKYAKDL